MDPVRLEHQDVPAEFSDPDGVVIGAILLDRRRRGDVPLVAESLDGGAKLPARGLPTVFSVNWFRRGDDGGFPWPGFGGNSRVSGTCPPPPP